VRIIADSSQGTGKIKARFSGCTGDWGGQRRDGKGRGLYVFLSMKEKGNIINWE